MTWIVAVPIPFGICQRVRGYSSYV